MNRRWKVSHKYRNRRRTALSVSRRFWSHEKSKLRSHVFPNMHATSSILRSLVRTEFREVYGQRIGLILLSDHTKLNALTVEMGKQFQSAVEAMSNSAKNQEIRGCVITGEGDAFSAGGDLKWLRERHSRTPMANSVTMVDFYNSFLCVRNISVPTIAAINGAAIGAVS